MKMIKPQKKSKSAGFTAILLTIIMIIAGFTTACQPTPEGLIVQNKADDDLKEAIAQTATPTSSDINTSDSTVTSETASANQQDTQPNEPIDYIEDISSNASNTVTVEINADVINNQPDNIPVVKIEPKEFTEQEVQQMVQAFFGNSQLYSRDLTKEDYDEWILSKQLELNDEEKLKVYAADRNIEDLSEARNQIQEAIDRMKRERQSASDSRVTADYSELYSEHGFNLLIDTGKGFLGNVKASKDSIVLTAFNDNDTYYLPRELYGGLSIELNNTETQFKEAKQMAVGLTSVMDIDSILGDAYLTNDIIEGSNREFYVFCFEIPINDTSIDHTLSRGILAYEDQYNVFQPYTRLEVWIENDQLVQFRYYKPIEVTQILNDNVAIGVDYSQAVELAKQHAYVQYVDTYDNYTEAKLSINKIELVMARTRENENGDYIIVPAWIFNGTLGKKYKPELRELQGTDEEGWEILVGNEGTGDTLLTVNALDGTMISIDHGY